MTGKAQYTSWLPRLQIDYRPSDDTVVRGSFFTLIARPEPLFISGATEVEEEDGEVDVTAIRAWFTRETVDPWSPFRPWRDR
jgi:hypothetical protein